MAFSGWGDGGEASTLALKHLTEKGEKQSVATLDPESFYDFQMRRPIVVLDQGGYRSLEWPRVEISVLNMPGNYPDLLLVEGAEPNYRWQRFSSLIADLLAELGCSRVVTLGAFIGQVPHTLPVPLIGTASDPKLIPRHRLFRSGYEGPTGIVGVLNVILSQRDIETVSVWAAVPHYVSNQDYTPGALALLSKALEILELDLDIGELENEATEFIHTVDAAIDSSSELTEYVRDLEKETSLSIDSEPDGEELVAEIERFLQENQT